MGSEFHIWGAAEGGKGTAYADTAVAEAVGVVDWYVKHTDKGYNVEFAIALDQVIGVDANGDKVIGFTALSTINYGELNPANPGRVYTFAPDAIHVTNTAIGNNDAKKYPSLIVVKGTAVEGAQTMTQDGRYISTLNAGTAALTVDGVKDEAYANGLSFSAKYLDGPAENVNEKNTFEVFMAADAEFVYVLYEIKDDNIVYDTANTSYWYFDCADFVYNLGSKTGTAGNQEFRIYGDTTQGQKGLNATHIPDWKVLVTEDGYNVEFKIARSQFTDKNVFSCNPTVTIASSATSRTYVSVENSAGMGGNAMKAALNEIRIVDAE
jgi:hypothetical protein